MLFCIVDLPPTPPRAGALRRIPTQLVGDVNYVQQKIPKWLIALKLASVPIEQWDMIARDQQVLVRVGTIHADRSIHWRKA